MTTGKKNICKNIVFLMQLIDMILHVHPEDPQPRLIKQIVESLQKGGIIIYPTDTVYGLGCDILQQKAVELSLIHI